MSSNPVTMAYRGTLAVVGLFVLFGLISIVVVSKSSILNLLPLLGAALPFWIASTADRKMSTHTRAYRSLRWILFGLLSGLPLLAYAWFVAFYWSQSGHTLLLVAPMHGLGAFAFLLAAAWISKR